MEWEKLAIVAAAVLAALAVNRMLQLDMMLVPKKAVNQ